MIEIIVSLMIGEADIAVIEIIVSLMIGEVDIAVI